MGFDFFLEPPPRAQCLFCGCNRKHGDDGHLPEEEAVNIQASFNYTSAITAAMDFRSEDGKLRHYREWMQGRTGQESLPGLIHARSELQKETPSTQWVLLGGRVFTDTPAHLVAELIDAAQRHPEWIWSWEN